MLDWISKERRFEKGNESIRILECESQHIDAITLTLSEIQDLEITEMQDREPKLCLAFTTENFLVKIYTDVLNHGEVASVLGFLEKRMKEKMKG